MHWPNNNPTFPILFGFNELVKASWNVAPQNEVGNPMTVWQKGRKTGSKKETARLTIIRSFRADQKHEFS
jgi:hypothetical protein